MPTVCSLFSGIGGIDLGFVQAGYDIVFANEIDSAACKTYQYNFGKNSIIESNICNVSEKLIPDFDVLTAGFPCQPFSVAGLQRGFNDKRGNLFFEITRIVDEKRPKAILLENVSNLLEHDNGKTFLVIYNSLVQFGYTVYYKVMAANEYGNIPQIRKRIYITALRDDLYSNYTHPESIELTVSSKTIINRKVKQNDVYYYNSNSLFQYFQEKMTDKLSIYRPTDFEVRKTKNYMCPTLTANMGTFPDRVPIIWDDYGIRKLTLRECLSFQGFPQSYYFPNSITLNDAYKQIGNSVCVPVIYRIALQIKRVI